MTYFMLKVMFTALLFCEEGSASSKNDSEDLFNYICRSQNKDIRPCIGCDAPLLINLTFHLTSLNDLDEVAGEMSSIGYLAVTWYDERIQWDPAQFGGLAALHMPFAKVWTPPLVVGNPTREISRLNAEKTLPMVMHTGQMHFFPGEVFQTKCFPDIYNYPIDTQECFISILPTAFLSSDIKVLSNGKPIVDPYYKDSGEWVLESTESVNAPLGRFSFVRFYFTFSRRAEFFIVNMVLPVIFLSSINCLVFLLPTQSGERVSFSVTVLLSFAVLMTLVSDNIPKTSDPMPLLCYYMITVFTGSALILLCTIQSINIYHRDRSMPISGLYKILVSFNVKFFRRKTHPDIAMEGNDTLEFKAINGNAGETSNTSQVDSGNGSENTRDHVASWQDVAMRFDKVCLVGFILYFITCSIIFIIMPLTYAK